MKKFKLSQKIILWLIILSLTVAQAVQPAYAAFCRNYQDNTICILSIKRSAKNYWEYRASVKVNGETRPIEIYNCRDRTRIKADGKIVGFEPNGAGELICTVLNT
jgi:hypothetical protein